MSAGSGAPGLDPPGFAASSVPYCPAPGGAPPDLTAYAARAMQIARGQFGGVAQLAFMLYMFVGNQLALFNLLILFSFGAAPLRNLASMEQAFAAVAVPGANLTSAKAVYIAINLAGIAVLLWKVKAMGLLPVTSADWVSLLPTRTATEFSAAAAGGL